MLGIAIVYIPTVNFILTRFLRFYGIIKNLTRHSALKSLYFDS